MGQKLSAQNKNEANSKQEEEILSRRSYQQASSKPNCLQMSNAYELDSSAYRVGSQPLHSGYLSRHSKSPTLKIPNRFKSGPAHTISNTR